MNYNYKIRDTCGPRFERAILTEGNKRYYNSTPFILTFCETVISEYDINAFIELGLKIVRFKMTNLSEAEKIKLLYLLKRAMNWCCEKYNVSTWPVTLTADVPNACIKTGSLEDQSYMPKGMPIKENAIVRITSDKVFAEKCNHEQIYVDDPYMLPCLVPGIEITINFGSVVMVVIEKLDDQNVKCRVTSSGLMKNNCFVCFRGLTHIKPALSDKDLEVIEFAKTLKFDIITINSVRTARTVKRVREMTKEYKPLVLSSICEQEGLDNIDSIIDASDGIILAGEFVFCEVKDQYKIITIQLYLSAKCRLKGKPLYLSGKILHSVLRTGTANRCDINDITNAVLHRSGFVLRSFKDPGNMIKALKTLSDICSIVEPLTRYDTVLMRIAMEYKRPVTAAQAAVVAAVFLARVTHSLVIIVPTVTGRTVRQVAHMTADNIIIAITSSITVAKQLQLFKGVIAIVYDKKALRHWHDEMKARLDFAVTSGLKFEVLKCGSPYVVLRKSNPTTSYCDQVSTFSALSDADVVRLEVERRREVDMIIINYPRNIATISRIKKYLGSKLKRPIIITGISTQEGLTSIDDFVREADGILLSREFLAYEVEPALYNRMGHIQSLIAGKCRQAGKPFYISGEIFNEVLMTGQISTREISDVTNAILEGASGFALSESTDINYTCDAMKMMNELCATVEPLCMNRTEFWQLVSQIKMPVNAAEASAVSCAVVANQTNARLIIVPTVTGRTAYLLNWLRPNSIVIAVSTKIRTIRLLKTFRSVIPLLYKADAQIQLVDIEKMMEMGMNVARFKTSHSTKTDKVKLINRFDRAATFLARKYGLLEWPCATCVELKTSVVQTGLLEEELSKLYIKEGNEIILTTAISEFDKCNEQSIFVDNPYLTSDVTIGMTINISQDEIIMVCTAKYENSVKCKVVKGGYLQNMAYVCMRGAVRTRPYISKKDLHLIKFAVEYQVDMIIINYPRNIATISRIKKYLGSKLKRPIIITGISTQEGLTSIDDFVREADGILLSREFLAYEVEPALYNRMGHIQSLIAGKCRQAGKPFYISGEIFNEVLMTGQISTREISDVTNAILEGASGFALSESTDINYTCDAMKMMNELCATVEPLCMNRTEFWQLVSQIKMPVNAAEASAVSCAVVANQTNARLIIVPTVTGRTAYLLNWLRPNSIVIAVSTKIRTIRLLKTFRSVIPLLYKGTPRRTWFSTVQARINFALQYAVEKHWILYGDAYVTLEKGTEGSSFCDAVRVWNVTMTEKNTIECPESYHDFDINSYGPLPISTKKSKTKITETVTTTVVVEKTEITEEKTEQTTVEKTEVTVVEKTEVTDQTEEQKVVKDTDTTEAIGTAETSVEIKEEGSKGEGEEREGEGEDDGEGEGVEEEKYEGEKNGD
uniref:Pyruvate kinase n=1 Tax=Heliothis virescens TaxID=7102 RepID=A0A2A4JCP4_HELVI